MPNSPNKPPRKEDVQKSIAACLDNADRLMDDALQLEFQERGGTRLAICMLAQEEYAKAFLLYLAREELLPWDADLLRVMARVQALAGNRHGVHRSRVGYS
jgi:hypothetical protein